MSPSERLASDSPFQLSGILKVADIIHTYARTSGPIFHQSHITFTLLDIDFFYFFFLLCEEMIFQQASTAKLEEKIRLRQNITHY